VIPAVINAVISVGIDAFISFLDTVIPDAFDAVINIID
jgi:Flp pilus assembly pilin Flp